MSNGMKDNISNIRGKAKVCMSGLMDKDMREIGQTAREGMGSNVKMHKELSPGINK